MNKVETKKTEKRQSLLDSAFHLFIENGYAKTSISDIARQAGVAKGTFYLYFKDKTDIRNRLVMGMAGQIFEKAYAHLLAAGIESFEDQIIFLLDDILGQLQADKKLTFLLSKDLGAGMFREAVLYDENESTSSVPTILDKLVSASNRVYREPRNMLYLIIEMISGSVHSVILYNQPMTLEELKPSLHEAVRGIMRQFQIS